MPETRMFSLAFGTPATFSASANVLTLEVQTTPQPGSSLAAELFTCRIG